MDIIYNIQHFGENKFLFNYTVNSDTPVFSLVLTNPWTTEEKTITLTTPDGTDGEWIFNIRGVAESSEDLNAGRVHFENDGTWKVSVSESGILIKDVAFQVVGTICKAYKDVLNYASFQGYSLPTAAQRTVQEALVCSLVGNGVWSTLDVFYVFRNTTREMASVNYKNPGIFDLPLTGTRGISDSNFEPNLGIIGVNSVVGIGGTYKLINLSNYSQNNASRFCWIYGHNPIVSSNLIDRDERSSSAEAWGESGLSSLNSAADKWTTTYGQVDGVFRHIKRTVAASILDYENLTENSHDSESQPIPSTNNDIWTLLQLGEAKLAVYGLGAAQVNADLEGPINDFIN